MAFETVDFHVFVFSHTNVEFKYVSASQRMNLIAGEKGIEMHEETSNKVCYTKIKNMIRWEKFCSMNVKRDREWKKKENSVAFHPLLIVIILKYIFLYVHSHISFHIRFFFFAVVVTP